MNKVPIIFLLYVNDVQKRIVECYLSSKLIVVTGTFVSHFQYNFELYFSSLRRSNYIVHFIEGETIKRRSTQEHESRALH